MTIEELLARSRARLRRLEPVAAEQARRAGAVLVDIRSELQCARDGLVPGAVFISRNVLEWRCDPDSPWRDPAISDPRRLTVLICNEGYQSSLAAATLLDLGLPLATDVVGGFQAWRDAGLAVIVAADHGVSASRSTLAPSPQSPIVSTILPSLPPAAKRS